MIDHPSYFCTKPFDVINGMQNILGSLTKTDRNVTVYPKIHGTCNMDITNTHATDKLYQLLLCFRNTHFHSIHRQATRTVFNFNTLTDITLDEQHIFPAVLLNICFAGFNLEKCTTSPFVPTFGTQDATLPYMASIPIVLQHKQWKQVTTDSL